MSLPVPSFEDSLKHKGLLTEIGDRLLIRVYEAGRGRGILVVRLGSGEPLISFRPARLADVLHFMSCGLPEECATSLIEMMRTYRNDDEAIVLVLDESRAGNLGISAWRLRLDQILMERRPNRESDDMRCARPMG